MNRNKNLGSKKKLRKAEFLKRQAKRDKRTEFMRIMKSGDIEEMAKVMGIKLK